MNEKEKKIYVPCKHADFYYPQDIDLVRSEKFSLLNEDLPTLDERLTEEFSDLDLDDDWTLMGPFATGERNSTYNLNF